MKTVIFGIIGILVACFMVYDAIDLEVARRYYIQNVKECKAVEGCLFDWNCKRYNKLIEKECK